MVKQSGKAILIALVAAALLAACAPGQSPGEVQSLVATSVAQTVEAQKGDVAAAVVATLNAQAPAPAATATASAPTAVTLDLPTVPANLPTVTPFVVLPPAGSSGGGSGSRPDYSCSWVELKPTTNTFAPGDAIDVVWFITNTGTKAWPSKKDLDYVSGYKFSGFSGQELPALDAGDSTTVRWETNAPGEKGNYGMQFKVEGGLCWPALNIHVGKPGDP